MYNALTFLEKHGTCTGVCYPYRETSGTCSSLSCTVGLSLLLACRFQWCGQRQLAGFDAVIHSFGSTYVARVATISINAKLAEGLHAGCLEFHLDAPLYVNKPNSVIPGLGMASLVSSNSNAVKRTSLERRSGSRGGDVGMDKTRNVVPRLRRSRWSCCANGATSRGDDLD